MPPAEHWPLFGLGVGTPKVGLRYPGDALAADVADLAAAGIHEPGSRPFLRPWDEVPPPHQQRNTLQHLWSLRATWTPACWTCSLAVVAGDEVIGVQTLRADSFAGRRTVETGSWLGRAHQGRGLGTEARAAALHLAFAGLGAERAESSAWHDNAASRAVSRKLGYEENGDEWRLRGDSADRIVRLVLTRQSWEQHRRDDIELVGLQACLSFFGAVEAEWLVP